MNKIANKISILLVLLILPLLGAGCGLSSNATDGGIYRSLDQGKNWEQKVFVGQGKEGVVTIANVNVSKLISREADNMLWAVAGSDGIFSSVNNSDSWRQIFKQPTKTMVLHPTNPAIFYAASGNKIWRTVDSGVKWESVYIDVTPDSYITDLAVTASQSEMVYATTSRGAVIRGLDNGTRFEQIYFFREKQPISKLLILGTKPIMYLAAGNGVLWRSSDLGTKWEAVSDKFFDKNKIASAEFKNIIQLGAGDELLYATAYGLFKVSEQGRAWKILPLLTPPRSVNISALQASPSSSLEIYYTAAGTLYHSRDLGRTWQTLSLPSTRKPTLLLIKSDNKTLYIGFSK